MVQRASEPVNFSTGGQTQLQGSRLGFVGVDQNAARAPGPSAAESVLSALLPGLGNLAEKSFQLEAEDEYLKGVADAATVESEDQLQTNPITADWRKAGYRDTVGRVAYAESEAKLTTDMQELRKKSPEEFNQYLAERRKTLVPQLEGMSRKQRESMLGQFATSDFAAVKKHGVEHQKYIVETKVAARQAEARALQVSWQDARATGDASAVQAETSKWQALLNNIATADDLPTSAKQKLIEEVATYGLAGDNLQLFDIVSVPNWGGIANPVFGVIEPDTWVKLSQAAHQAEERTKAERSIAWQNQDALVGANIGAGNLPAEAEYQRHLQEGVRLKFIEGGAYNSRMKDFYTEKAKVSQNSGLAAAVAAGDWGGLYSMGADDAKGVQAWEKLHKDLPLSQAVGELITIGQKGMPAAFKRAAELSGGAWAQLQTDPTKMLPQDLQIVGDTMNKLSLYEKQGNTAAVAGYLSAFKPETQGFIELYRAKLSENGGVHSAAAAFATEQLKVHGSKTAQQKAGMNAANSEWEAFLDQNTRLFQTPGAIAAGVKDWVSGMFGGEVGRGQQVTAGVVTDFFEKDSAARLALRPVFEEVRNRAEQIANSNPALVGEPALNMAKAEVFGNRIIPTAQGPLLMSKGVNMQQVYGTNASHTPADIGKAIDRLSKVPEGFRRVYTQDVFGNLSYQDVNKKSGASAGVRKLPASAIKDALLHNDQDKAQEASWVYGQGRAVKQSGITIEYNGNNTAGVSNGLAYEFRGSLLKFEGITDTVKQDVNTAARDKAGNPVLTFGVGVSSTNAYYPQGLKAGDKVPVETIQNSFNQASDAAMRQGTQLATRLGVRNNAGILFSSQLAYQAGNWVASKPYQDLSRAIARKDVNAAVQAFDKTPAAQFGNARREWYKFQLRKMLG